MTHNEICKDNRFNLIKKYKDKLIECTNIETSKDEMAIIDNVLFRFYQMGWLGMLEDYYKQQVEVERLKEVEEQLESDVINERVNNQQLISHIKTLESVIKRIFMQKAGLDIDTLAEAKANAIKEFAKNLCEDRVSNDPVVIAVKTELEIGGY